MQPAGFEPTMWGDPGFARVERNEAAVTHGGSWAVRKALGVDGVLALQPTFLLPPAQFWGYAAALRGRRLPFQWVGGECAGFA